MESRRFALILGLGAIALLSAGSPGHPPATPGADAPAPPTFASPQETALVDSLYHLAPVANPPAGTGSAR
ncbi:MAG: hypothetical protein ACYDAY_00860 [Candidatus Dormibacteria bacterium]